MVGEIGGMSHSQMNVVTWGGSLSNLTMTEVESFEVGRDSERLQGLGCGSDLWAVVVTLLPGEAASATLTVTALRWRERRVRGAVHWAER